MKWCVGIVLSLLLASGCATAATPGPQSGSGAELVLVDRVIDGDTVELADGERVRLLCVDTPERGHAGFAEAGEFLRGLVEGKPVRLEADPDHDDRDRWGRLLRYVWLDDVLVNAAIVRAGHSEYATKWGRSSLHEDLFLQR